MSLKNMLKRLTNSLYLKTWHLINTLWYIFHSVTSFFNFDPLISLLILYYHTIICKIWKKSWTSSFGNSSCRTVFVVNGTGSFSLFYCVNVVTLPILSENAIHGGSQVTAIERHIILIISLIYLTAISTTKTI